MRRSAVGAVAFAAGCAMALSFSWVHVSPVLVQYRIIPSLLMVEAQSLEFSCRDSECVTCLQGVRDTPDSFVFTGGSTWRYALDFADFSAAMPRPVVNCIRNDSRIDAYQNFFGFAPFNQPTQVVLHGYNSWAVNSPGTWVGNRTPYLFAVTLTTPESTLFVDRVLRALDRLQPLTLRQRLALLYFHIFYTRAVTEAPYQWRMRLRLLLPAYASRDLSFWPLSKQQHWQRRLELMKRSFSLSAYVHSFIIGVDALRPASEIAARHERFLETLAPSRQFVFFPSPELNEVFPERVKEVIRQSKVVMLEALAKHPGVQHIDVDYKACGLVPQDFWHPAAMYFDIPHVNNDAQEKLTACVTQALTNAKLERLFAAP